MLNLTWGGYFDGGTDRVDILAPVRGESLVRTLGDHFVELCLPLLERLNIALKSKRKILFIFHFSFISTSTKTYVAAMLLINVQLIMFLHINFKDVHSL